MSLVAVQLKPLPGNIELLDKKIDGVYTDVSRLFIYYNERKLKDV